jgi:hypothetical protein
MIRIDDATACRRALVHGGYTPLPLYGKEPPIFGRNNERKGLAGWQHLANATSAQILMWQQTWPDAANTGILTALTPVLDLDIVNELAAIAVEDLVREHFEERGHVLIRIGKPPKRAIPFRTLEPFDKIKVPVSRSGFEGLGEKVELLASGQQLVVHGIHPETREPYRWFGGSPWTIAHDELPYISAEEARHLIVDIVALLSRDYGYQIPRTSSRDPSAGTEPKNRLSGTTWTDLVANIISGADLHESLRDLAAKLIRSGMHPGSAVHLLRALMEAASIPHDDRWQERYDDIPRAVNTAVRLIEAERQIAAD